MTAILEVHDLCKTYHKAKQSTLEHLTFEVESGSIYAFVGPNGAGKTTTIRILATLLGFEHGEVRVGSYRVDTQPHEVRRLLGYIPDEFGLYKKMSVREYLEFFAQCYHVPETQHQQIVDDLLDLVGLSKWREETLVKLSRGMRQRLSVARALVHDPQLIVADEPAAGLDPRARVDLREIFQVLQEMGKTIFLSSHVLRELDDIATHVGILEEGRLVATGTVDEIRAQLQPHRRIHLTLAGPADDAQAWLVRQPGIISVTPLEATEKETSELMISLQGGQDEIVQLLSSLVMARFPVLAYVEEKETLESLFLNLTRQS